MYVCICHSVTEKDIKASIKNGAETIQDLQVMTGCATGCGSCLDYAEELIQKHSKSKLPKMLQLHPQGLNQVATV